MNFLSWLFFTDTGRAVLFGFAAVLGVWFAYQWAYDRGYAAAAAEFAEEQHVAAEAARIAEQKRDRAAERVADETRDRAEQAVAQVETETQAAAERVRTVIRTVEVPANCPQSLPAPVNDEGQRAVDRANAVRRGP